MEKAFISALNEGWENLLRNIKEEKIDVLYFGQKIELDLNSKKFIPEIEDRDKIIILHYLLGKMNSDIIKDDEFITFKELPEGTFYYPSIYSRIYLPLIEKYKKNPDIFIEKGISKGGEKTSNFSIRFKVFPDVHYIIELIPEDDEFPADIRVFFNKKSSEIFEIEDLAIIGEIIVSKME
ncbi:MAG: DUF3786 domain-containing protein [bacterium]|nr:DUF3786 domain-containing protein [bacterium]MCX7917166.1 DUF3786 domain-containing protein [bacterium]MDW8163133.1 DUF3786 domain-containing protein [Candidatus Omnitrophota bacterium]